MSRLMRPLRYPALLLGSLMLAACASTPQKDLAAERLEASLSALNSDAALANYAAAERLQARQALAALRQADKKTRADRLYVAEQRLEIARIAAPICAMAAWKIMACDAPDRFTANMSKAKPNGRIFMDYLRNERGSTAIAPFSTRAREGAPVAVPVSWTELAKLDRANGFSLAEAAKRAGGPDPWKSYADLNQSITKPMRKAMDG